MPGASANGAGRHRVDRVVSVPLVLVFQPDPDPTERYPGETADIDGYVMAPDHTVTVAATATTPGGLDMLDSVWAVLQRKGVGRRRMILLDDRGRTVFVMTLSVKASDEVLRLLQSMLVVPVHARDGLAEVHFFATADEIETLEREIEPNVQALPHSPTPTLPLARETGALRPEDWAFLGLLTSIGAFDVPEGPSPKLVAELLGLDPEAFAEKAVAVEHGLGALVTDLFAPTGPGGKPERAAA